MDTWTLPLVLLVAVRVATDTDIRGDGLYQQRAVNVMSALLWPVALHVGAGASRLSPSARVASLFPIVAELVEAAVGTSTPEQRQRAANLISTIRTALFAFILVKAVQSGSGNSHLVAVVSAMSICLRSTPQLQESTLTASIQQSALNWVVGGITVAILQSLKEGA